MDGIEDIISSLWEDVGSVEFNPNDYAMEAEVNVYPNWTGAEWEPMPAYTVDDLKMDIEPMLFDLDINQVSELTSWIFNTRYQMQSGGNVPMTNTGFAEDEMSMPSIDGLAI